MTDSESPVKVIHLGGGDMDRKLSLADLNSLLEESKVLQERVELLEKSRFPAEESVSLFRKTGIEQNVIEEDRKEASSSIKAFELPESTYTLMITTKVLSISFLAAIVACFLSVYCLTIVLINELDKGDVDNPLGLPAGVNPEVRMAQYLVRLEFLICLFLCALKSFCPFNEKNI